MIQEITADGCPLRLKPIAPGDLDFFVQMYADAEIMRFIGRPLNRQQCEQQLQATILTMQQQEPHHLTYVVMHQATTQAIGITGFTWFDDMDRTVAAVGVMIKPLFRRQRMAHRAKKLMINDGFVNQGLEKICAFCQIDNVAANTANERLQLRKGRVIQSGVNRQQSQEWFIEKTQWNQSYLDDI